MIEAQDEGEIYYLENEKYTSARLLGRVFSLCGERGELGAGIYTYLIWVDDNVDRKDLSQDHRMSFLQRQRSLLNGKMSEVNEFDPHELAMINLPWDALSEEKQMTVKNLLGSITDTCEFDVENSNLDGRNAEDVKDYANTLLKSAIRITSIIVNDLDPNLDNDRLDELMFDWMIIGSLADLKEDLDVGLFHVPLTENQIEMLNGTDEIAEKEELINGVFLTKERFTQLKWKHMRQALKNSTAFLKTDMPMWQRIMCSVYSFEIVLKYSRIKYPEFE